MTTNSPDPSPDEVVDLPPVDDDYADGAEHPDEVTEQEAAAGQEMYEAVVDRDDDSNGIDGPLHPSQGETP